MTWLFCCTISLDACRWCVVSVLLFWERQKKNLCIHFLHPTCNWYIPVLCISLLAFLKTKNISSEERVSVTIILTPPFHAYAILLILFHFDVRMAILIGWFLFSNEMMAFWAQFQILPVYISLKNEERFHAEALFYHILLSCAFNRCWLNMGWVRRRVKDTCKSRLETWTSPFPLQMSPFPGLEACTAIAKRCLQNKPCSAGLWKQSARFCIDMVSRSTLLFWFMAG